MAIYAIAILIRAALLDPQWNLKKIWHPKLEKNGQPVFGPDSDPIFGPRFSRWCSGNVKNLQGRSRKEQPQNLHCFQSRNSEIEFFLVLQWKIDNFPQMERPLTPSNHIQNIKKILGQIFTKSQEPGYSQENSQVHS